MSIYSDSDSLYSEDEQSGFLSGLDFTGERCHTCGCWQLSQSALATLQQAQAKTCTDKLKQLVSAGNYAEGDQWPVPRRYDCGTGQPGSWNGSHHDDKASWLCGPCSPHCCFQSAQGDQKSVQWSVFRDRHAVLTWITCQLWVTQFVCLSFSSSLYFSSKILCLCLTVVDFLPEFHKPHC